MQKGNNIVKAISYPLSIEKIDKVVKFFSCKICEHYFSMLEKHAGGGEKDDYAAIQHFITDLRSNIYYCKHSRIELGIYINEIRNDK